MSTSKPRSEKAVAINLLTPVVPVLAYLGHQDARPAPLGGQKALDPASDSCNTSLISPTFLLYTPPIDRITA